MMQKNNQNIELLSPVGDFSSLKAAINAGADSCYLGGRVFSARARANNFEDEEMVRAIDYAHTRGVRIYVAVNTLIKDSEMIKCLEYCQFLSENGVDALIVQDIGLISLIRKSNLTLPLHLSTQSTITTHYDIEKLKDLNISRIVLPREMNIKEISFLNKNTSLELEAFIHGSICVCYSGKCLFSSLNGGRSGNRGSCAQICRKPYDMYLRGEKLTQKGNYLISPKDLSTVENLDKILDAGVTSLKIEGRMKNKSYIYITTKVYREIIDEILKYGKASDNSIKDAKNILKKVFNRDFTKGYILSDRGAKIINPIFQKPLGENIGKVIKYDKKEKRLYLKLKEDIFKGDGLSIGEKVGRIIKLDGTITDYAKGGDVIKLDFIKNIDSETIIYRTYDEKLNEKIKNGIKNDRKLKINVRVTAKIGEKFSLEYYINDYTSEIIYSKQNIEKSKKIPLAKSTIIDHISRIGDTDFEIENIIIDMDDNIFFPISVINEIRRDAVSNLKKNIVDSYKRKKIEISFDNFNDTINISKNKKIKNFIKINSLKNIKENLEKIKESDVLIVKDISIYEKLKDNFKNLYLNIDPLIDYNNFEKNLEKAKKASGKIVTASYSFAHLFNNAIISPLMNSYNSFTHNYYNKTGNMTIISYENAFVEKDDYRYIKNKDMLILPVYGYPEYMVTEFCPHKDDDGRCRYNYDCRLFYTIFENREKDRLLFEKFSSCKVIIYPEKPHKIDENYYKKMIDHGFTNIFIELRNESLKDVLFWR